MPVNTLGYREIYYNSLELAEFINESSGSSVSSIIAAISSFGVGTCAGFLAGGVPGAIIGNVVGGALGVQSIQDTYDEYVMTNKYRTVLNGMKSRYDNGFSFIGYAKIKVAKRQWVSSNGNSYSGVYEVPIDAVLAI